MRLLLISALLAAALHAQDISATVHDPTGNTSDTALPSTYQFPNTPAWGTAGIVLRLKNQSVYPIQIAAVVVGAQSGAGSYNPNFTVTGLAIGKTLAPNSSLSFEDITLNFTPQITGATTGYLQATYQIQQNGCDLSSTNSATQCPSNTVTLSTLQGTGTSPQLVLTYNAANGSTPLQPNSSSPLSFGNVSTSATSTLTFTITNQSATAASVPQVSLQTQIFGSSAFRADTSSLPSSLAPGVAGSFSITFAPGQTGQANATLIVGSAPYPITGTGIVLADIDALQISYVDSTGVRTSPQAATPIDFGQVIAGTNTPATLTFTVANPATSFNAVSLSTIAASGAGFSLSQLPQLPVSIAPGTSISFKGAFSGGNTGTYNGTLAIGTRQFSLTGKSIDSAIPDATIQLDQQPLTSQKQAHVSIQLASASTVSAIGQLSLSFTPSATNISDDPAINFLATSGRQLQVSVAPGAQNATLNGQSAITFQTGTTAGTLTFTLTFPNKAPVSQSFTIASQTVQLSGITAVRQNSNLVVTFSGFDNTYTAGKLSFLFYDQSGKQINASPITIDASSGFHQYFFSAANKAGGAFSAQATFPVTGDITQVGSVSATVSNSSGTSTTSATFQ